MATLSFAALMLSLTVSVLLLAEARQASDSSMKTKTAVGEQIVAVVMEDTLVGGWVAYPIARYRNGAYGPVDSLVGIRELALYEGSVRIGRFHVTSLEKSKSLGCFEPMVARGRAEIARGTSRTSSLLALGVPTVPIRAVSSSGTEAEAFVRAAASRVLAGESPDARNTAVRAARGTVPKVEMVRLLDLDGDGVPEVIGRVSARVVGSREVYGDQQPMDAEVLVLGALPPGGTAELVRAWVSVHGEYPSNNVTRLEGIVDVDGDGTGELVISWAYGEAMKYSIYEYRRGALREVFQGRSGAASSALGRRSRRGFCGCEPGSRPANRAHRPLLDPLTFT